MMNATRCQPWAWNPFRGQAIPTGESIKQWWHRRDVELRFIRAKWIGFESASNKCHVPNMEEEKQRTTVLGVGVKMRGHFV